MSRKSDLRLTRISHHLTVEARDRPAITSLRLLAVLNVLSRTPPLVKRRAPRTDGPLMHFASPRGEKSGLSVRSLKRPGMMVINPDGKEVGFIPTGQPNQRAPETPVGLPSNVEFGIGEEANMLYVTVDLSLYRVPLKVRGYHVQYR